MNRGHFQGRGKIAFKSEFLELSEEELDNLVKGAVLRNPSKLHWSTLLLTLSLPVLIGLSLFFLSIFEAPIWLFVLIVILGIFWAILNAFQYPSVSDKFVAPRIYRKQFLRFAALVDEHDKPAKQPELEPEVGPAPETEPEPIDPVIQMMNEFADNSVNRFEFIQNKREEIRKKYGDNPPTFIVEMLDALENMLRKQRETDSRRRR